MFDASAVSDLNSDVLSSAVFFAPNKCTQISCSSRFLIVHHVARPHNSNKSSRTITRKNIASISAIKATGSFLKQVRTQKGLLVRS